MHNPGNKGTGGFTLVEMLVAMVVGSMLLTSVYRIWIANQKETSRISTKGDYRDRATIATTALNRAITMAGFGISKMNVIKRGPGQATDTLTLYTNASERRTTLMDTAQAGTAEIRVFSDSGFVVGGLIGITDSLQEEYCRVTQIHGDMASGFRLTLAERLLHKFKPGMPDIYPVEKEKFYLDLSSNALLRVVDGQNIALANGITEFRVEMRDASGNPTNASKNIRVVTFTLTGTYKAPAGTPSQMRFSSTVIPRNIL